MEERQESREQARDQKHARLTRPFDSTRRLIVFHARVSQPLPFSVSLRVFRVFHFATVRPDGREECEDHQRGGQAVEIRALREYAVGDEVDPVKASAPHVRVVSGQRAPELEEPAAARAPVLEEVQEAEAAVEQEEERGYHCRELVARDSPREEVEEPDRRE